MPTVKSIYQGQLRTEAIHVQSNTAIYTDAPTDNQGKGEAFSPTDLVATALGSCMMTIMGILANRKGWDIAATTYQTTKIMAENPRRVTEVQVVFEFPPNNFTDEEKQQLQHAALACPVAKSLSSELKQTVSFNW